MRKYVAARTSPSPNRHAHGPTASSAYHKPVPRHSNPGQDRHRSPCWSRLCFACPARVQSVGGHPDFGHSCTASTIPICPRNHVALVFGAGLNRSGGPSAILYDRVATAADIYKAGKVRKLLMTGDNSADQLQRGRGHAPHCYPVGSARQGHCARLRRLQQLGSCYRAREVFSLQSATLVTQKFHLPRALFTCNQLSVKCCRRNSRPPTLPHPVQRAKGIPALAATAWRLLINDQPRFLGPEGGYRHRRAVKRNSV